MRASTIIALAASVASASAQIVGFNSGSAFPNGAAKQQSDFEAEFRTAQNLPGADCFTSFRLFTTIQGGTANTPISAIPAAIATNTRLLLGLWGSAGQDIFNNEVQALLSAVQQYGSAFTDLIDGISVGSEDLYRVSTTGIINMSGVGAGPATLSSYIQQLRSSIQDVSLLSGAQIGHVDTWTAWVNGSNQAVIDNVDWVGMDAYPYFQNTQANSIDNAAGLFNDALSATEGAAGGKPVWVTESGWPLAGATENQAVPSVENAKRYWDEVACTLFGRVNTWWYILRDAGSPDPTFGIVGQDLGAPFFNLTCPAGSSGRNACGASSSSSSASSSATSSSSVSSASAPSTTAASATVSVIESPGAVNPTTSVSAADSSSAASASATGGSSNTAAVPIYPTYGNNGTATQPSGTAGTVAPSGTGPAGTIPYTGAASNAGAAVGAGLLAVFGIAAAL